MPRKKRPKPVTEEPLKGYPRRGPRQDGRWWWQVMVADGKKRVAIVDERRRSVSGWYTREELLDRLRELAHNDSWELASGLRSRGADAAAGPPATLDELIRAWLAVQKERIRPPGARSRTGIAEATYRNYMGGGHIIARLGGELDVTEFASPKRAVQLLEEMAIEAHRLQLAARTQQQAFKILSIAWGWAKARGHVPPIDLPSAPIPKVRREERILNHTTPTDEQIARVVDALGGWHRIYVLLLWYTGARSAEVGGLTWDRVSLEGDVPFVDVEAKTATGTIDGIRRRIPIADEVVSALKAWRSAHPAIGGPVLGVEPVTAESSAWRIVANTARAIKGVPVFTPHGIRRQAATNLIASGIDPKSYEAIMGHTYEEGLRVYAQVQRERVQKAVPVLGRKRAKAGEPDKEKDKPKAPEEAERKVLSFPGQEPGEEPGED